VCSSNCDRLLNRNRISSIAVGVGAITQSDALSWGSPDRCFRAPVVDYDCPQGGPDLLYTVRLHIPNRLARRHYDRFEVRYAEIARRDIPSRAGDRAASRRPHHHHAIRASICRPSSRSTARSEGLMNHFKL